MRRIVYNQVAAVLRDIPASAWPHIELIAERFDISVEAVLSIYSQENQNYVIKNLHRLKADYILNAKRYVAGEDVLDQAFRLNFSPCLVIRGHLLCLLGISKQRATDVLKDPSLVHSCPAVAGGDFDVTPALRRRMETDVARCVEADWLQTPRMDAVRHISGLEGEAVLCTALAGEGVPFWSEETLRDQGYIKTPDIRLQVPIATAKGAPIDWIDSKATFGDETQHRTQLKEQYAKYVNRYGHGAVIYWSGYVSELQGEAAVECLTLLSDLPTVIRQLPQLNI